MHARVSQSRIGRYLAAALMSFVLTACAHNEVGKLDVSMRGNTASFSSSPNESDAAQAARYVVLDVEVRRRNCDQDCTVWMVARHTAADATEATDRIGPIDYGSELAGMLTRTGPEPLAVGTYSVTATIQEFADSGVLIDSKLLHADFGLRSSGAGLALE